MYDQATPVTAVLYRLATDEAWIARPLDSMNLRDQLTETQLDNRSLPERHYGAAQAVLFIRQAMARQRHDPNMAWGPLPQIRTQAMTQAGTRGVPRTSKQRYVTRQAPTSKKRLFGLSQVTAIAMTCVATSGGRRRDAAIAYVPYVSDCAYVYCSIFADA